MQLTCCIIYLYSFGNLRVAKIVSLEDIVSIKNLDARRIQSELFRNHDCSLSFASIHKVLKKAYATADLSDFEKLQDCLAGWAFYYNWHHPHGSLNGKSPNDVTVELSRITPFSDEVYDKYDIIKEHIQLHNYHAEMAIQELKKARKN